MTNWKFKNKTIKSINDVPEGAYGFIYQIEIIDKDRDKSLPYKYIGKKNLYFERKVMLGKREYAALGNKRLKKYKYIKGESDWCDYNSSCKPLIEKIANGVKVKKTILEFCYSKMELTYKETKHLFNNNVLEEEEYFNSNILNKFFKGNIG